MTITCKEAARMVSEGLDRKLPAGEQLRLHAHLVICRGCRSISERMSFLRRAVKRAEARAPPHQLQGGHASHVRDAGPQAGLIDATKLKLHLACCTGCARFKQQLEFLRNAMGKYRE